MAAAGSSGRLYKPGSRLHWPLDGADFQASYVREEEASEGQSGLIFIIPIDFLWDPVGWLKLLTSVCKRSQDEAR